MNNSTGYEQLIQKLNRFIRKYYTNQLIKGTLLFIGLNLFLFIIFNVLESQFYFSSSTRKVLFYSGLGVLILSFIHWIARPIFRFFQIGQTLDQEEAARIIGDHFPQVKDKLLNILQLARQTGQTENDLLLHSIEQKTNEIKLISFPKAIDLSKNRKYLRYALPPFLILIVLLFSAPSMITDSSYRLLHNNEEFERQAPFDFQLENTDLSLPQFEDIEILMNTEGSVLPQEAFITIDNFQYKMKKNDLGQFSYTLKNVGNDTRFFFSANGFSSVPYEIKILKKPSLARMKIDLDFPDYTGIKDKSLLNEGDFIVPAGTKVMWTFDTENMSKLGLKLNKEGVDTVLNTSNNIAKFGQRIYRNTDYRLVFNSSDIPRADSVQYFIESIPDEYPRISLQNEKDSLNPKIHYILGEASDDYGIRKITYNYALVPEGANPDQDIEFHSEVLSNTTGKAATFDKIIDIQNFDLAPGAALWYYFEVFDNDGVRGSKSSKTAIQRWTQKTIEEFEELEEQTEQQINSNLEDILKNQEELIKSTEELRNKLLQEKELSWQRKKEMEELLKNQDAIQQKLQETQQMHEQNSRNQEEFKNTDQQNNRDIQKMMEQAQNPKLEQLMQKIQELMDKMKKDEAIQELEQMSQEMNQTQMDLKRLEQLYKKLEMESDLMDQAEKLEELAEKQKELARQNIEEKMEEDQDNNSENTNQAGEEEDPNSEESKESDNKEKNSTENSEENKEGPSDKNQEENIEKQKKLNEEFEKISQKLEELHEKNKSLESPAKMDDPKTTSEDIKKDQNQSMEEMQSGSPQKAGQKQKDAGDKMQQMAESMQQNMQSGQEQQAKEDIKTLRQILENLVRLSFDQETLIDEVAPLSYATPQYVEKVRDQFKLKSNFSLIRDSLMALAGRNAQIETTVTEKVNLIDTHLEKSLKLMEEQEKSDAANDQRRTMKNVNDLALMLTEALQNMQMQMAQPSAMCQNPGNSSGSVPMDKITEGQKKLTEEMKNMAKKRQEGKGKGGEMSKDFAQTAAEQAALRKMLEEKQQKLMEQGKGSKQLQQLIDMMDGMETDLVNKKLTNEMMQRQQEILTRLLEAEKAEREQEMDEQRKAEEAKNVPRTLPPDLQKYLERRREEITPYQKLSPALKPYYKQLVEEYYEDLKNR
ncbi:DUF4175 domain-containing protein [Membranicola marinus]|uniref:DUF4175 domain-containing protein n=1 Tax=Membranihabitans marinus TaxID=1227546 RepID=A0A953HTX6_9BACT|nr:DUF4175 family protein [Membranihabitans marinus]MBY5958146.1 DUF4175 domain-containing protein [Membranihabitans marinus]